MGTTGGYGGLRSAKGARATITSDIYDQGWMEDGETGPRHMRTMILTDVPGEGPAVLYNALTAQNIPRRGDWHPIIPNLFCNNRRAMIEPGCTNTVRVELIYEWPMGSGGYFINEPSDTATPQLEVSATVQGATADTDINGDPIEAEYFEDDPEGGETIWHRVRCEVELQLPMMVVRYFRRERGNPHAKAKLYVHTINSEPVFGDPPHFWMCTAITGVSDDGSQTFNVTYEFQRNPDGWDRKVIARKDGEIPPGAQPSRPYQLYPEADFYALNLTV